MTNQPDNNKDVEASIRRCKHGIIREDDARSELEPMSRTASESAADPAPAHEPASTPVPQPALTPAAATDSAPAPTPKPTDAVITAPSNPADPNDAVYRVRKQKKKSMLLKIFIIVGLVVTVVFAICVGVVSAGSYLMHQGLLDGATLLGNNKTSAVAYDEGHTVEYEGSTYVYNENVSSVLFIGYDKRLNSQEPRQADALILFAIDSSTGKTTAIAIPRDSMVDVDAMIGDVFTGVDKMQICLSFAYGDDTETSCEYTSRAASRIMYNIPIAKYFALNMQGVAVMNDAIGGVELTPIATIPKANAVEGVPTVLEGSEALAYVQSREKDLTASLDRQERQTQYVQAFATQALAAAKTDSGILLDLYNIAMDYSTTNLGPTEFGYLAANIVTHGITSPEMITLSGTMEEGEFYSEYYLDKDSVFRAVLNTYYTKIEDAKK